MNRRIALSLFAGIATTGTCMSIGSSAQGTAQGTSDADNLQWVGQILEEMQSIKPGMTRADLLNVFTTEGGLSTEFERTYVSRRCGYFKVDVTFKPVGRDDKDSEGRATLVEDARDEIVSISRPYLAFSVMD
ncbi:MAG: hypothetical protein WBF42_17965 [Terracidiphilus sp.]